MRKLLLSALIVLGLSGCSENKTKILDFPSTRQSYDYSCGPGAVQAVMAYYGNDFRESQLIELLQTDKDNGTYVKDIVCSDPALFKAGYIPIQEFMDRWHDYDEGEIKTYQLGLAVYGKNPIFILQDFERIK